MIILSLGQKYFKQLYLQLLIMIIFCALAQPSLSFAKDNLVIGAPTFLPPFVMSNSKYSHTGFDIAYVLKICQRLKKKCQFRDYPINDLIPALQNEEVDAIIGAISIEDNESADLFFTTPYLSSRARFITHEKLPKPSSKFHSLFDYHELLKPYRIGVSIGSNLERRLYDMLPKGKRLIQYANIHRALEAIQKEKIDLLLTDAATANFWQQRAPSDIFFFGNDVVYGKGYGIAFSLKTKNEIDAFNQQILYMQEDGTFLNLYRQYMDF